MAKKSLSRNVVVCAALALSLGMFAQGPVQDIDAQKHPTLASAQKSIGEAYQKLDESQKAYKDRLGGHAEKAKDLLVQANQEIKMAADYANQHP